MAVEYSAVTTYDDGLLDTGDGNLVAWETRGNPGGKPALILHGGPGVGRPKGTPKSFDPTLYRIVLFDQRGCGLSTPHASDPATDMSLNTTDHLLRDIEQLRVHLGVDRWLVFGGSWGSALAVAYAQRHPDRVSELVMPAFWTMSRAEIAWLYRGGVAPLFPEQWNRFCAGAHRADPDSDVIAGYAALLQHPDLTVRFRAAQEWSAWEDAVLSLEPQGAAALYSDRPSADLIAFVRICAHYAQHDGWLPKGLLADIGRLRDIPGVIVHGRHDLSCPLVTAWNFAQAWPSVDLIIVDDAGHKGSPEMTDRIRAAIRRFEPTGS